ncbi:MAG: MjaI family restriction endonuclease [Spirochaetia bacterium]|nr:MjaI family restriction endonuclease [Spirochaetia bacterium]
MADYKIPIEEVFEVNEITPCDFPKYTTQIINLANQNAKGTRPSVVGQMSDLIQECPHNEIAEWKKWYLKKHPDAIKNATTKITASVANLKDAIKHIDEDMIRAWVEDLIFVKTAEGLLFQKAILTQLSEKYRKPYRLATPEEESKGIDGFIGEQPVSIKPDTYDVKTSTKHEKISVPIIIYKKTSKYLTLEYDEKQLTKL